MPGDRGPNAPSRLRPGQQKIEDYPRLIKISDADVEAAQEVASFGKYPSRLVPEVRRRTSVFRFFRTETPSSEEGGSINAPSLSRSTNSPSENREAIAEMVPGLCSSEASHFEHEPALTTGEDCRSSALRRDSEGRLESDNSDFDEKEKEDSGLVDKQTKYDKNCLNLAAAAAASARTRSTETQMDTDTERSKLLNTAIAEASANEHHTLPAAVANPAKKFSRGWNKEEEVALAESVHYVVEHGGHDKDVMGMWEIIAERVKEVHNVNKSGMACRMWYSRKLRERTGYDERKTSKPNQLATCVQKPATGAKRNRKQVEDDTGDDGDGDEEFDEGEDGDVEEEDDDANEAA